MIEVTDEMLKPFKGIIDRENKYAIIDAIQDMLKGMVSKKSLKVVIDAMPKQEPVCYVYQPSERLIDWNTELFKFSFELPEEGTPLYTHPQPQQKPLSEDEIFELFSKQNFTAYKIDDGTDHNDLVAVDRAFIDFARSIEKAHGIGVNNESN
jgi:hypothetical protein